MTSSDIPADRSQLLQALSALHDGEADETQRSQACGGWRQDAQVRAHWHAWHLIGDVMRSEDLCSSVEHDAAFLARIRERLKDEPVVFAPTRLVGAEASGDLDSMGQEVGTESVRVSASGRAMRASRRWAAPAAVAAGFMAVAGALVVLRDGAPGLPDNLPLVAKGGQGNAPSGAVPPGASLVVQRNPDLDRYLAAHRQFAQGPALAAPGGLRQVVVTPDAR